jgi:hypothetical protein
MFNMHRSVEIEGSSIVIIPTVGSAGERGKDTGGEPASGCAHLKDAQPFSIEEVRYAFDRPAHYPGVASLSARLVRRCGDGHTLHPFIAGLVAVSSELRAPSKTQLDSERTGRRWAQALVVDGHGNSTAQEPTGVIATLNPAMKST